MTLKEKIDSIDYSKIGKPEAIKQFVAKVEEKAKTSMTEAQALMDGILVKIQEKYPDAITKKIAPEKARAVISKLKKLKNIVPRKADYVKIADQIQKQQPNFTRQQAEDLAKLRIEAQIARSTSFNDMINVLSNSSFYSGRLSTAPIDKGRVRDLQKDSNRGSITEADELKMHKKGYKPRKYKRISKAGHKNQYGTTSGGNVYYEYRDNRRDVDSKIRLAEGGLIGKEVEFLRYGEPKTGKVIEDLGNERFAVSSGMGQILVKRENITKVVEPKKGRFFGLFNKGGGVGKFNVGDKVKFNQDPSGKLSDNIYYGTILEINNGVAKIAHQNSNMKNVTRSVNVENLQKYSEGGGVRGYYFEIEKENDKFSVYFYKPNGDLDWGKQGFSSKKEAQTYGEENIKKYQTKYPKPNFNYEAPTYFDDSNFNNNSWRSAEKMAKGKVIKGGGVNSNYGKFGDDNSNLVNFDIDNLDAFEFRQYVNFSKSLSKAQALQVLINDVEGDYSQLSEELSKIAEEQMPMDNYNNGGGVKGRFKKHFRKGGNVKATYIPNASIKSLTTKYGSTIKGKDLLDGAYTTRKNVKLEPKVDRFMFEEEMYEYGKGGVPKYALGDVIDDADTPKVWVGEWSLYNEGKLIGEWVDLTRFDSGAEVMEYIQSLLEKWTKETGQLREEYAIFDYENFPSSLYSEQMGEDAFDKVLLAYNFSQENDIPMDVVGTIIQEYGADDLEEWFSERYAGQFDSDTDLAYWYVDEMLGGVEQLDKKTQEMYFDYESFGRDLAINDYRDIDGYYFQSYKRGGMTKQSLNRYFKRK